MSVGQTSTVLLLILATAGVAYWKRSLTGPDILEEMDISQVERSIMIHIHNEGDDIASNIADARGHHPSSIVRSASNLEDRGLLRNKGRGVYSLTEDGEKIARRLADVESLSEPKDSETDGEGND